MTYRKSGMNRREFLGTAATAGAFALSGGQIVQAQRALQDEIQLNTTTIGFQHQPSIASLFSAGDFVATWVDRSDASIKGQRVARGGRKLGSEFVVNSFSEGNTDRQQPVVLSIAGGGFLVTWIEKALNPPGRRPHVHTRRFDGAGSPVGPQEQVSTTDIDHTYRPAITGMIDGGFLITWVDSRPDQRIRAQRFNIDGGKTGPERVTNTSRGFHEAPLVIRLVNGNYVVAWRSDPSPPGGGTIMLRIFDLEGAPQSGEIRPRISGFRGEKAMTLLDNGGFVIVHVRTGIATDLGVLQSIIEANIFDADGTSQPGGLTATSERGITCSWPAVAPLPGGRFLVTWVQKSAETFATSPSVRARILSADRGKLGEEVQPHRAVAQHRAHTCAATIFGTGEGEFAFVAWDDDSGAGEDSSDLAVRGRPLAILPSGGL